MFLCSDVSPQCVFISLHVSGKLWCICLWKEITRERLSSTWILTAVESNKESCGERVVLLITPWTNAKYWQLKPQEQTPMTFYFKFEYFHLKKIYLIWMSAIFPRPYCVNSLWPSDIIWWQGSRSTLAQVMACCLTAPSHYLNQRWLIIS